MFKGKIISRTIETTPFDTKHLFIAQKRPIKRCCQPFSNDGHIIFLMSISYYCVTCIIFKIGQGFRPLWQLTNQQRVFIFSWDKIAMHYPVWGILTNRMRGIYFPFKKKSRDPPYKGTPCNSYFYQTTFYLIMTAILPLEPVVEEIRRIESQQF